VPDETAAAYGTAAINLLEARLDKVLETFTTDELAEFWQGATEACALRLIRLKPEMVHPSGDFLL